MGCDSVNTAIEVTSMNKQTSTQVVGLDSLWSSYQRLSKGHRFMIIVFMIWFIQAVPKWTVAITADGELSAKIMKTIVTPRAELDDFMSRS